MNRHEDSARNEDAPYPKEEANIAPSQPGLRPVTSEIISEAGVVLALGKEPDNVLFALFFSTRPLVATNT
jgi:hypothetical protein